jgi:hypothetical protein
MRLRLTLGIAITGALALGCTTSIPQGPADSDRFGDFAPVVEDDVREPVDREVPEPVIDQEQELPQVQVIDANMTAQFTNGISVRGDATDLTTWVDYGFTEVDVIRGEEDAAAMGLIFIGGNLDSPVFTEVGSRTVFQRGVMVEGPEGAEDTWVDYTACAGPDVYVWDIDVPADEVVVIVEEGPNPDETVAIIQATIGPDAQTGRVETQLLLSR